MSLNKENLKLALRHAYNQTLGETGGSIDTFIESLATAIDDYVKAAEVVYVSNLVAGTTPVTSVVPETKIGNIR